MDKTFLTVKELSIKLGVSEKTVYRMITSKSIPFAIKIGGQWRFNSEKIEKWSSAFPKGAKNKVPTNDKITISEAMTNGLIIYRAHGENRDEILDEFLGMVGNLSTEEIINIKKQILYRESIISSSLQGISFMTPGVEATHHIDKSQLFVAFLEKPMNFKAIDNIDTEIVLLLLAANKTEQLILKTRLTRLLMEKEFIAMVKKHLNRRELLEQVTAIETKLLG
ncbi:helix-turn-helix domain-containing protein [uncultured Desulfuromusa sp.]|uniref:helix-turn-helix domain-containing protein n=1 Tax=uncultured Desulfuromusa sp. TaxID=219183 RepID=UPI002AA88869|nr:helix-turn-helix domain-containing protein [uncultured Desulfuromusa sp.]